MMDEIWLPVNGYEGSYEVSNLGRVRTVEKNIVDINGKHLQIKSKILKSRLSDFGYPRVLLCEKRKVVHRLVAIAFIPNPENKAEVNHVDGCKTNNVVTNLEWVTREENMTHAFKTGLNRARKGNENRFAKLTPELIKEASDLKQAGIPLAVTARRFGVSKSSLCRAVKGTSWNHLLSWLRQR